MNGDAHFGDAGAPYGFAKCALDAGPTHGISGGGGLLLIAPGGRKEPGLVTVGFPVEA